jgi:AraC-like DNA-binding protein
VQDIPLVRARYIHGFAAVLDRIGAPTERLIHHAGLSGQVLGNGEAIVPAYAAWSFIGAAARKEGIYDFGLQAGDASLESYGEFSRRLLHAPNLNKGIETFCRLANYEYSRANFYVSRNQQLAWFCRGPIDGDAVEKKHVELLVLTMMIAVIRLAAGPNWRPREVFLQTEESRGVRSHDSLLLADIHFGNQITALGIPLYLLPKQLPQPTIPSCVAEYDRLGCDLVGALRHVITSLLHDGGTGILQVAEAVGMTGRTLQRRLSEANTTFSAVAKDVRMSAAMSMIANDSASLSEIALQLGYSDQGNFTRAFRRWTGVSPRTYRLQQLPDYQDGTD